MALASDNNRSHNGSVLLGQNTNDEKKDIIITEEERLRSISVVGATGTGKSTLLRRIALQGIENHETLIYFAVDYQSISNLLMRIPKARMKDVILLDFNDRRRFLGIHYTAADRDIEQAIELFKRLWDIGPKTPNLENTLRASLKTLQYNNLTLDRMPDLLRDKDFRKKCLPNIPDTLDAQTVRDFWEKGFYLHSVQEQIHSSDSTLNKIMQMYMDKYIGYILAQDRNTLHIKKDILDNKKILLIHLSKQDLQPERVRRIGAMILEELKFALFSRPDPPPDIVNLICDEWQLYLTPDFFEDVLSQGRRYGVSTVIATQTLANFDDKLQAIVDQVGTHITFAVGRSDAIKLAYRYARDAQPYMREQELKTPISKPVNWLLSGGRGFHPNNIVYEFLKHFQLEKIAELSRDVREPIEVETPIQYSERTRVGSPKTVSTTRVRKEWITRSGEPYREFLRSLNDFFYQVMRDKNFCRVFPFDLFLWLARERNAAFLDPSLYKTASPLDYIGCLLDTYEKRTEAEYCYNNLWLAEDGEELTNAFADYEQAVREYLTQSIMRNLESLWTDRLPNRQSDDRWNIELSFRSKDCKKSRKCYTILEQKKDDLASVL